jgi:vacuolar-type H+-ATPase subunit F/Vma7
VKFYCIADEDTVRGFRLAGVAGEAVASALAAATALAAAVAQRDCAVIILTESVADSLRSQVEQIRFERQQPLLVVIPGANGPLPGRKGLRQLAQEAVGLHIETGEGG